MDLSFLAPIAMIRKAFGIRRDRRKPAPRHVDSRPGSLRLQLEQLEDRNMPSAGSASVSAVPNAQVLEAHTLEIVADHLVAEVEGAAQAALANPQMLAQALGPTFLQGIIGQTEKDLAPLLSVNLGAQLDGLFNVSSGVEFGQEASAFIRNCLQIKCFPRCATQAADGGAVFNPDFGPPLLLTNLPGAIVYATACYNICDRIYTCEISPCVQQLTCDAYDDIPPSLDDVPEEIEDCVAAADAALPPVVQDADQAIQQCIVDPGGVAGVSQTLTMQIDNPDGSLASSSTFILFSTGVVQCSQSSIYNADGSVGSSLSSTNFADGSAIAVLSILNAGGLVGSEDVTLYRADGSVALSVTTTDTEAADKSLAAVQGIVADGTDNLLNTFTLTNDEDAAGTLTDSATATDDGSGATQVSAAVNYDPATQAVIDMTATNFDNGVPNGFTAVDGNGDSIPSGTGGVGDPGGGGATGGANGTGGGGGGFTGGGGGFTGGGGGFTGGGGGFTGGGDAGGGDAGGDFSAAAVRSAGIYVPAGALTLTGAESTPKSTTAGSVTPFAGIVGSFAGTDLNPADYAAVILWGDGTASAAIVSAAGYGDFNVLGSRVTAPNINNPIFVSVTNVVNGDQILAAQPASLPFSDSFTGLQLSASWADEAGGFIVVNNQAMASSSSTPNVAVLRGVSVADVSASVTVTNMLPGETAGLVARYQGPGDLGPAGKTSFYYGDIKRIGNAYTAEIWKNIGGESTRLASVPISAKAFTGTGMILFEAEGTSLRVIATNGPTVVAHATDSSITTPGTVGIWGTIAAPFKNFNASPATPTTPSISPSFTDPFAATPDGRLNTNWVAKLGDFSRNASGNLAATASPSTSMAVLNGVMAADVSESVGVINLLSGQTAALVARYRGTGNGSLYYGGITRSGKVFTAVIYKDLNGVWTRVASTPVSTKLFSGTGTIQFEVEGPSLRLFVVHAGTPVLLTSASDRSITTPGSVGIRGTSGTQFNNCSVSAVTLTAPSISPSFTDSFAATPDGQLSSNWVNQSGDFSRSASGNLTAASSAAPSVAVLNGVAATDVSESAGVTNLVSGQTIGLVARYQGAGNGSFYFGGIARTGNAFTAVIYKNLNGVWTRLASTSVSVKLFSGTGTIQFDVEGPSLRLFVVHGGTPVLAAAAADKSITTPGSVGIRGTSGTQVNTCSVGAPGR